MTEVIGSEWKYRFIRRSEKKVDIEISKIPLGGQQLVEHAIRLRDGAEPLATSAKVTRGIGPESSEDELAFGEINDFIVELESVL